MRSRSLLSCAGSFTSGGLGLLRTIGHIAARLIFRTPGSRCYVRVGHAYAAKRSSKGISNSPLENHPTIAYNPTTMSKIKTTDSLITGSKPNTVQSLLIAKYVSEKEIKELKAELRTGQKYEAQFQAEILGELSLGEPTDKVNDMPWKQIALYLLSGKTPKQALKFVETVLRETPDMRLEEPLKELAEPILGRTPVSGRLTSNTIIRVK